MHTSVTAQECGLEKLTGSSKQINWATSLRDKALQYICKQGWHGTSESFLEDVHKLPTDASWWIDNQIANSSHEATRQFLGLEYTTPAGADY